MTKEVLVIIFTNNEWVIQKFVFGVEKIILAIFTTTDGFGKNTIWGGKHLLTNPIHDSEKHNPECTQSRVDTISKGHDPERTPSQIDTISNGHNPEWALTSI